MAKLQYGDIRPKKLSYQDIRLALVYMEAVALLGFCNGGDEQNQNIINFTVIEILTRKNLKFEHPGIIIKYSHRRI